ncbi:uracil-xanthine permease family protein [Isachenkonia alkalipeptolytica]|uniref:Purine permease n=1 Tax=Isachenkonia alkalipeptolytica TaxID=2565777 RepID=A0AA43XKN1_9CLOT|nr:nucleobase:cation symporter-2 family protein [Isachenkonia alkalipeptolytica]NBG88630.1 purine permease [Isachenkonia alkalipeptolytica]
MDKGSTELRSRSVFELHGLPSMAKAFPLGIQHVLAMLVGNITPAIIIGGVVGLGTGDATLLVQSAMFIAGIATLIQLYPMGKAGSTYRIGSGLPVIMGVSFAYIPPLIAIGSQYGIAAILGAQMIGGVVAVIVGIFIKPIRKYFPPMVAGTVVFTIGLSLYPTAINYMAGGMGQTGYGSYTNWLVAVVTLLVVLFCNQFAKGYLKLASILVGILAGYFLALPLGLVDFAPIAEASWFALPRPLYFGIEFYPSAILTMAIMYVVNSVQAVGDLSATTVGGMGREISDDELSGGIIGNGVASVIASLFGGLPTATYSQNVGIVSMTKVISKFVLALAAGMILLAGFVPKVGALMTTIPHSVLGGATITVFALITMTGIRLIIQDELSIRNITIVGLAVALGVGISQVPEALEVFPQWFMMIFGSSAVVISAIVVFSLNLILPKKTLEDERKEREIMEKEMEVEGS